MKRNIILMAFLLITALVSAQNHSKSLSSVESKHDFEPNFEQVVRSVIDSYNRKDVKKLNQLIHKEIGLYFMYLPGSVPRWTHQKEIYLDTIQRENVILPYWNRETLAFQKIKENLPLKKVQTIDVLEVISSEKTPTEGLFFVDNPDFQKQLSFCIKTELKYEISDIETKRKYLTELKKVQKFEQNTRCIVAIWQKNDGDFDIFIFYVTKMDKKWYLTMIDFSSLP
ncbi:hypothetical protein [Capnocytophaga sp.]|uniref:hypothetical protein n=1 Tax=Capnocytophaga sp. TaxID=44737 RepID=UPI0026DC6493|nr:hypothetical protein [Capnocytophaga sp.]MDO5105623.1 hypothetical protein [Capnocytophaga sp.]